MNFKKFLITLPLLAVTTIALGQPSPGDKVWLPRTDALRKLAQADSLPVYKRMLAQTKADMDSVAVWLARNDKVIQYYAAKDSNNLIIIGQLRAEKNEIIATQALMADRISKLNLSLAASERKRKRGRTWARVGALAGMAGAFFLGTKL